MALYKLTKNETQTEVHLFKDGTEMNLRTDVFDTGVTEHGWGGEYGNPDQLSFALAYDILENNLDEAKAKYKKISSTISVAAPFTIELSTEALAEILRSNNGEDDNSGLVHE